MRHDDPFILGIGEVARLAGVSPNAVRHYERYGVVRARRTSTNTRRFSIDAVCRVKLAQAAQRVGMTLAESAEILAGIPPASPDVALWQAASQRLVDAGEARLRELTEVVYEYRSLDFIGTRRATDDCAVEEARSRQTGRALHKT